MEYSENRMQKVSPFVEGAYAVDEVVCMSWLLNTGHNKAIAFADL